MYPGMERERELLRTQRFSERAEKIDKANKQVLEEKLLDYQSQENHDDQNIAELAIKNSSFIKAVLDKIG